MNTCTGDKRLIKYTYSQKETYLIDVRGYSEQELLPYGEIGLDNIIIDNYYINEFQKFSN